jgi:outer membrane lipoprotein carrier protein
MRMLFSNSAANHRPTMTRTLTVLLALLVSAAIPRAQTTRPADALARDLQTRYQSIRDFSASFVQSYRAGVLKTQTRESGTVAVKKPGKMRWVYVTPERKEFVSNGSKMWVFFPEEKQATVRDAADQATTPDLFLSGRGDIARDFTPSYVDSPVAGTIALKLVPRKSEPEYEYLILALDPAKLQIRGLTTRDHQGGESTFTFANMKENLGLSDKDFEFRPPRGVTVVTDNAR